MMCKDSKTIGKNWLATLDVLRQRLDEAWWRDRDLICLWGLCAKYSLNFLSIL